MPNTYYVDAARGLDGYNGLNPDWPWQSLARAQVAALNPGDQLLFRRGGTWAGSGRLFAANWRGTRDAPIRIGSYGDGPRPTFQLDPRGQPGDQLGLEVTGQHLSLTGLRVTLINPYRNPAGRDPTGAGVKFGWYIGLRLTGSDVIVTDCEFDHLALGAYLTDSARRITVAQSHFHDLDVLWRLAGAAGAMGALGVLLHGIDNQIIGCLFENNWVECVRVSDGKKQTYSAPVEFYNANRCAFRANQAYGHRKNGEFGKDPAANSADNAYTGNLIVSDRPNGRGPNIHGHGVFGPVERTLIAHNTIVLTGAGSQALISGHPEAIVRANILVGQLKAAFFRAPLTEDHNIFWGGRVEFTAGGMSPTSRWADPQLDADFVPHLDAGHRPVGAWPRASDPDRA